MSNLKIQNSREYREYLLESLVDNDRAANYIEGTLERELEDPIQQEQIDSPLRMAANLAIEEYTNDRELTIFACLDGEDFLD
jgi:ATP-dependent Clp protease ATP-binding subunit ClpA